MRRFFGYFFVWLFMGVCCFGQNTTTITGTVTDPDTQTWNFAYWSWTLYNPNGGNNPVYKDGTSVPKNVNGVLSSAGAIAGGASVPNNAQILPTGTQARVVVCPIATTPCQSFTFPVTGSTFAMGTKLASLIKPIRIESQMSTLMWAYNTTEILNPINGYGFVNTTTNTCEVWNSGTWVPFCSGGTPPAGDCGPLAGDATSTNCGNQNQTLSTGTTVQTFGYQNLTMINAQSHYMVFGDGNLSSQTGFATGGSHVLVGGDANLSNMRPNGNIIVFGSGNARANVVNVGAALNGNSIIVGDNNAVSVGGIQQNNYIMGSNNVSFLDASGVTGSVLRQLNVIIGEGNVTDTTNPGNGIANNVVIGQEGMDGLAGNENVCQGVEPCTDFGVENHAFNQNVAIGKLPMFDNENTGSILNNVSIGAGSLGGQTDASGACAVTNNVAIGQNNIVSGCATHSIVIGTNNDLLNPTVTNAIVLANNVSGLPTTVVDNTTQIGNSQTVHLKLFGCPTGQTALNDGSGTCYVPGTGGSGPGIGTLNTIPFWDTTTTLGSSVMSVTATGGIAVGSATNVAPSQDPTLEVKRVVGSTISHGVAVDDVLSAGANPYAAYDSRVEITGAFNINHYAGYQDQPTIDVGYTGTLNNLVNFVGKSLINGGTITNRYAFLADDVTVTGGATVGTQYGFYVPTLSNALVNHGIRVESNDSFLGGPVTTPAALLSLGSFGAGWSCLALNFNCNYGNTLGLLANGSILFQQAPSGGEFAFQIGTDTELTITHGSCSGIITCIPNIVVVLPTTAIAANTCTTPVAVPVTGVTTTMTFTHSWSGDPAAATGWGSTGGLVINDWPTAGNYNWEVCNQTGSSITPGAISSNVGFK